MPSYCTLSVKVVVCCTLPALAVTVTVDELVLLLNVLDEPPQPENMPSPAMLRITSSRNCSRLRLRKPKRQSATASVAARMKGLGL